MGNFAFTAGRDESFTENRLKELLDKYIDTLSRKIKKILILPPDATRKHSGAGQLTNYIYKRLKNRSKIKIMPALGTHDPMSKKELLSMFGDIPLDVFVEHNWREDTVKLGEIPSDFVDTISESVVKDSIEVKVNRRLVNGEFDLIISIGQVLPHEVVGMANYSKNILVGTGGEEMINKSHFIGAAYGLERLIGKDHSPVRKLYDYAEENFISNLPLDYILTVNKSEINEETGLTDIIGLFIGRERELFEKAVALSQETNINFLEKPVNKFVVYLDEQEFKSTWLGCKGIYRTRLAVANGGEIIIIAPGLVRLGEDDYFDNLIRKYGYVGTDRVLKLVEKNADLQENLAAAAHLIHGSTEGRFSVTLVSDAITKEEIEGVNFNHMTIAEAEEEYMFKDLSYGYNELANGEEVFYIENPATGLWVARDRF